MGCGRSGWLVVAGSFEVQSTVVAGVAGLIVAGFFIMIQFFVYGYDRGGWHHCSRLLSHGLALACLLVGLWLLQCCEACIAEAAEEHQALLEVVVCFLLLEEQTARADQLLWKEFRVRSCPIILVLCWCLGHWEGLLTQVLLLFGDSYFQQSVSCFVLLLPVVYLSLSMVGGLLLGVGVPSLSKGMPPSYRVSTIAAREVICNGHLGVLQHHLVFCCCLGLC